MNDQLQTYALDCAEKLRTEEANLSSQILAIESAIKPLEDRAKALRHRRQWLREARQKLEELATACKILNAEEIPF